MRRTAVGKTLIVLLAILVVTALSLSIAVASGKSASAPAAAANGQDGPKGNACPENSKNPNGTPPNCGHAEEEPPPPDSCNDGIDNDEDGDTDADDAECQDPDDGVEDGSDEPVGTCEDGLDNDEDGLTDADDPECQDPDDGEEDGSDETEPSCGDPDGDGVDHSAFDNDSNEGGPVSSIVHEVDQAIPPPLAGDQGVVTEINCALIVTVEELLGIDG